MKRSAADLRVLLLGFLLGFVFATPHAAANALDLELVAFQVTLEARGDSLLEVLVPALEVAPGELLVWRLTARRSQAEPLADVLLDLPIPDGTAYVEGSSQLLRLTDEDALAPADAVAHRLLYSADGGATYAAAPLTRTITNDDGTTSTEIIAPQSYTHVRVAIDTFPGEATLVLLMRTVVR